MSVASQYRQALCVCLMSLIALPTAAADPRERLDRTVPALLADKRIASVSIARIEDRRLAFVAAYGEARPGVAATPATLYNIASMTKPISAEVVLRLTARDRLSLDEPMAKYWIDPDLAADPRRDLLTPRLALSHRTGFPNWRDGALGFERPPGVAFGYSGEGFEYMARFVERKTGTPFETLAQELVFAPAGMRETAYMRRPWFEGRIAVPHDGEGRPLPPQIATRPIASDDAFSTPRDYARFMLSLMARQGMDASLADERARIQTDRRAELCPPPDDAFCADEAGMGLGWEAFRIGDQRYLMHTGMDAGTFTLGYFSPDTGDGTIVFTNSSNGPQGVLPILDAIGEDRAFVAFLRELAH
ncbi:MAG: serine hydrolase domain-containing protein [Pseudomonadota bacterium]